MKDVLNITRFDGESALISNEDKPGYLFSKIENLRPNVKIGSAVKRKPYTAIPSLASFSSIQTMKEFMDKNGTYTLVVIGDYGIAVYKNTSGVYSSQSYTDNNNGTIDGSEATIIDFNGIARAGVGTSTTGNGDKPLWYGYMDEKTRFSRSDDPITIAAGNYLEPIGERNILDTMFSYGISIFESKVTSVGATASTHIFYISPVYDGYQHGFPDDTYTPNIYLSYTNGSVALDISVADTNDELYKRLTGFDVFVAATENFVGDHDFYPANFVEHISFDDGGKYFLELDGTFESANPPTYIEFDEDFANWETLDLSWHSIEFTYNSVDYKLIMYTRSENGTKVRYGFTADGMPTNDLNGVSITGKIKSNWAYVSGSSKKRIRVTFDDYYKKGGSDMFTYLNIPAGDTGIEDFKYRYLASNGDTFLYSGFADGLVSYFSVVDSPDIVPAQNIIKHRAAVRGVSNVGQDFIVFTDIGVERIRLTGDTGSYKDQEYSDAILTSNRAFYKPNDDTILFMSYNGPAMIIGDKIDTSIGWHLREWWLDTFSASELESCVVGYNLKEDEAYFSFPDYSDSDYPNGIVFVFDFKSFKSGNQSPWWRIKSDMIFKAFALNSQQNLLVASNSAIVDFNTPGTDEEVSTSLKIKTLENPKVGGKVRFDRVYLDSTGDDTVTPNCYVDDSLVGNVTALNDDGCSFLREVGKTLEVEFTTAASTNNLEHKKVQVSYKAMRK